MRRLVDVEDGGEDGRLEERVAVKGDVEEEPAARGAEELGPVLSLAQRRQQGGGGARRPPRLGAQGCDGRRHPLVGGVPRASALPAPPLAHARDEEEAGEGAEAEGEPPGEAWICAARAGGGDAEDGEEGPRHERRRQVGDALHRKDKRRVPAALRVARRPAGGGA